MRASNVIAAPMSRSSPRTSIKSGRSICSLVLLSLCAWVLVPSVAECAPDQGDLSALNQLGIRYAKGQGVTRNRELAMRFFLRSAIRGYTPAMANLGTLYEIGAKKPSDFQRAYAWVRTALSFGVPEEDHDATMLKLGMIAARLGPDRIESAERLAESIATRIVESCKCSPGQETELASNDPL